MALAGELTGSYSPALLKALEQAFDAVWTTLYAHVPTVGDQAKGLKIALSQTLIAMAAEAITDPQQLRRRALEKMALSGR